MKIVINSKFGGFGLSPMAIAAYAKRKRRKCFFFANAKKADGTVDFDLLNRVTPKQAKDEFMFLAFDIPNPNEVLSERNWNEMTLEQRKEHNELYRRHFLSDHPEDRADKDLIAVVERLGKKANGKHANLKVITIPAGVDWVIEEHDGLEHVAEKHRTWV